MQKLADESFGLIRRIEKSSAVSGLFVGRQPTQILRRNEHRQSSGETRRRRGQTEARFDLRAIPVCRRVESDQTKRAGLLRRRRGFAENGRRREN